MIADAETGYRTLPVALDPTFSKRILLVTDTTNEHVFEMEQTSIIHHLDVTNTRERDAIATQQLRGSPAQALVSCEKSVIGKLHFSSNILKKTREKMQSAPKKCSI